MKLIMENWKRFLTEERKSRTNMEYKPGVSGIHGEEK
jgi:hypothetical protein